MTRAVCPLCASADVHLFLSMAEATLIRCTLCGLVFQPSPALAGFAQAEAQYDESNLAHRRAIRADLLSIARRRFEWVRRCSPPGARLLEVGGGTGEFSFAAQQHGWYVTMLELSASFVTEAKLIYGLSARRELLTANSFSPASFDVIALFHVLEHLPQPDEFLDTLTSLLAPGGRLALILPNLDSATDRMFGPLALSLRKPDHLFHYTLSTLERLLKKHGLVAIQLKTVEPAYHLWTSLYGAAGILRRRLSPAVSRTRPTGVNIDHARLPFVMGCLSAPITWPYRSLIEMMGRGHEIYCIAHKPA